MEDAEDDFLAPVALVPVSQWVYDLYEVKFYTADPIEGGILLKTSYWVGAFAGHMDVDDAAPHSCRHYEWKVVEQNVPKPRYIGHLYGHNVSETGWATGARMRPKTT